MSRKLCRLAFLIFALAIPGASLATEQAVSAGLAWLDNQRGQDGSFHTAGSVAAELQALGEILVARAEHGDDLSSVSAAVLDQLNEQSDTELLSIWIRAAIRSGRSVDHAVARLLARQNSDGGFADELRHGSSVLATAVALQALRATGFDAQAVAGPAVSYLVNHSRDGGWGVGTNPPDAYTTSLVMQALAPLASQYNLRATIDAAIRFLMNQRVSTSHVSSWESAHALLALMPAVADAGIYGAILRDLIEVQTAQGSWDDDVYTTALVLRVLRVAERLSDPQGGILPSVPTHGTVSGLVVSDYDGAPLSGATVSVAGTSVPSGQTTATGAFQLDLPAGQPLVLVYQASGYLQATQSVTVGAGGVLSLGVVRLPPMPDHGRLFGAVFGSDTGAPLVNAVVRLQGASSQDFPVAGDGSFDIVLPAGLYEVQVEAPGYHAVFGSFALQLAQAVHFAPVLVPDTEPLDDLPSSLTGIARDGETGAPLPGVVVSIEGGSDSAVTGSDGSFLFEQLIAGSYSLTLSRDGYYGANFLVTLPPSTIGNMGHIDLTPVREAAALSTVYGVVTAAEDGTPVSGALVSAGGQSVVSDADGGFRVEGIEAHSFTLRVSAQGYVSREYSIQLPEPGSVQISVTLDASDRGGLRIGDIRADQPAYEAHSEAVLTIDLANTGPEEQVVRMYLSVTGPAGEWLGETPVTPVFRDEESLDVSHVRVAPGELITETFSWFTEAHSPGDYILNIRAYQAFNGDLLGERSLVVRVQETRRIELVSVRPSPLYLTQGAVDEVAFELLVQHRSNVPFPTEVTFELRDPSNNALHSHTIALDLDPAHTNRLETLPSVIVEAQLPGAHPIEVIDTGGYEPNVVHGQPLYVAPGTRVEIRQRRTPAVIAPDGSHLIEIEIKLEGMGQ